MKGLYVAVDLMWSIPALLVIIVIAGTIGGGYWTAVALLLVLTIPFDTIVSDVAAMSPTEAARAFGNVQPDELGGGWDVFSEEDWRRAIGETS